MSHDKFNRVQKLRLGDRTAKAVLSYIAERDGKEGCTASRVTMSLETEIPERTINRKIAWLKSLGLISVRRRHLKSAIMRAVLPDTTDLPFGGKSVPSSDQPSGGSFTTQVNLPPETNEPAIPVADKLKEHAGRAARTGQPSHWQAPCAHHSGVPSRNKEPTEAGTDAESFSAGRSASRASLIGRSADLPLDGPEMLTSAHTEANQRIAFAEPARLDRPIITADQRRENEAEARLNADLLKGGLLEAAIEWIDDDRRAKAIAAEVAEPSGGFAFIRQELLKVSAKARANRVPRLPPQSTSPPSENLRSDIRHNRRQRL